LSFQGEKEKEEKSIGSIHQKISIKKIFLFSPFPIHENLNNCVTSCPLIQKGPN
jgi:hypothetical protein